MQKVPKFRLQMIQKHETPDSSVRKLSQIFVKKKVENLGQKWSKLFWLITPQISEEKLFLNAQRTLGLFIY